MTTKEQERKALEKIEKILLELGDDSYLGFAFDGCIETARGNIDNDFANSPKHAIETLTKNLKEAERKLDEARREKAKIQKDRDEWKACYETKRGECKEWNKSWTEVWNKYREQEDRADALELENIKLKAKLYDLITAE